MANKRIIELNERTTINMGDFLMVDDATGSRKLAMSTLFNYLTYSSLMFVDTLPTTDIDPTVIYLVPHSGSTTQWDEYIYRDNQWQLIGTSTLDLTSIYQTKTDNNLQTDSKQVIGAINEINSNLSNLDDVTTIETLAGSTSKYLSSVPKKLVVKIGDGGTQYQVNHLIYTDTLESNRKEYIYIGNGYMMATFVINKTSGEVYVDTLKVNGVDKTSTAQGVLYSA